MCLYNILGEPEQTSGIGYKVYTVQDNTIYPATFTISGEHVCRSILSECKLGLGTTYHSNPVLKSTEESSMNDYVTGFHIFENLEDARDMIKTGDFYGDTVVKVSYNKARIKGTQNISAGSMRLVPCIVADEITLLEIINN